MSLIWLIEVGVGSRCCLHLSLRFVPVVSYYPCGVIPLLPCLSCSSLFVLLRCVVVHGLVGVSVLPLTCRSLSFRCCVVQDISSFVSGILSSLLVRVLVLSY